MSQDNKKSFVMYQGDGSNNVFSVPMTKGKFGTISVAFVRRGLSTYQYNPATFTLNSDNTLLTWTGATLNVGDFIVIQRTTTREQPFEFPNNQKHLEKSDDNLERQIQEVADKVDNALLVDPTHAIDSNKMTPLQWMATILRSVDSSVRGFKIVDSILYYSADDPNIPEGNKTWTAVLNTTNVTTIRERNNYLEYSVNGGKTWKYINAMYVAFKNITGRPEDNAVLKNALNAKQDLISDLNDIRSGASKGESSVQLGDLATVATTGAIDDLESVEIKNLSDGQYLQYKAISGKWQNVSSTASIGFDAITGSPEDNAALESALQAKADTGTTLADYNISDAYTKTEVDTALSGKANAATTLAGYDISDAYTKTEVDTAISTKADTTTVNNELATKATKATDFMTALTSINKGATKTEIDALDNKIDITGNNKADLNLMNTATNVDFVIESQEPTGSNNYTWYRKYKSGWVEQGCLACFLPAQDANTEAGAQFTFPIAMLSSAYDVNCALMTDGGFTYELTQTRVLRTTSNCNVAFYSTVKTAGQSQVTITIRGMAAN